MPKRGGNPKANLNSTWVPGVSGNPSGRPRGFTRLIRDSTEEGLELVTFALSIMRGRRKAPIKLRFEAMCWLADRGWGRAVIMINMEDRLRKAAVEHGLNPEEVLAAAEEILSTHVA